MIEIPLTIHRDVAQQIWQGAQLDRRRAERFGGLSESELEVKLGQVPNEEFDKWADEDKIIDHALELSQLIGRMFAREMMAKIADSSEPMEDIRLVLGELDDRMVRTQQV